MCVCAAGDLDMSAFPSETLILMGLCLWGRNLLQAETQQTESKPGVNNFPVPLFVVLILSKLAGCATIFIPVSINNIAHQLTCGVHSECLIFWGGFGCQ